MATQPGNRETGVRIPQWLASAIVGLVCTAAVAGFGMARSVDITVVEHNARLRALESRVADLCEALQCRTNSSHPLCTRLRLVEKSFQLEHPGNERNLFD